MVLKIINPLLLFSFLFQILTIMFRGTFRFHSINGFVFIALVILHMFFNRRWIINNFLKK